MSHHVQDPNSYTLRNHPERRFEISSKVEQADTQGAVVVAEIREGANSPFIYRVEFSGEFTSTKENFDAEMYLYTALSLVLSQLESLRHSPTLLRVHHASGLVHTEPLPG